MENDKTSETKDQKKFEWRIMNFNIHSFINGVALLLCTFSLLLITISLRPLAKWANYQTICVDQESVKAPISWAVRKCNGRSKVYQVK